MSSFKNAAQAQRRTHRERSQPAHRKKFGLLEKHKDYIVRAKDFHRKKNAITKLKHIAEEKNPDEYYRQMIKSKTKDGVHQLEADNTLSPEVIKLLKTQDHNYLTMKMQVEKNKLSKMSAVLHGVKEEKVNTHTVFLDTEEDVESFDRDGFEEQLKLVQVEYEPSVKKSLNKAKKQQYNTYRARQERLKVLQTAADRLQVIIE